MTTGYDENEYVVRHPGPCSCLYPRSPLMIKFCTRFVLVEGYIPIDQSNRFFYIYSIFPNFI